MSDLDTLVDMGFDREKSQLALKHGGNLPSAIDWLDKNSSKSIDELNAGEADDNDEPPALKPGEEAKSLVCNECGKRFRSTAQAEFHASKTEHTDFAESTEEIAPLTEEQKKAKLEELKARRDAKRLEQQQADKEAAKRNEQIRLKSTKEQQDAKEALQQKERIKEAMQKKKEKQDEIDAKKRIQAKIAEDKAERKRKADAEKAAREGKAVPIEPEPVKAAAPVAATTSKPTNAYTETRLRLQTTAGTVQKAFPVETTLIEVAQQIGEEKGVQISSLQLTYPKKTFDSSDFGLTLKEAGLVPSAALIAK